jgi:hypothetical protein
MRKWISELSVWYRISVVISLIWIIGSLIGIEPWYRRGGRGSYGNIDDFLLIGVLPVVIFWGLIWIVKGFKKSGKT